MDKKSPGYKMNLQGAKAGLQVLENFEAICDDPKKVMNELLLKIVRDNAETEYGKKYGFDRINSMEDYKRSVPVITYDDIDSYMERMKVGEKNLLTSYHYTHLTTTSGTTGKQKAIPLTDEQSKVFLQYSHQLTLGILYKELGDSWMDGRCYCTAQGTHVTLPSGLTLGCASSVLADICKSGREPYSSMLGTMYTSPPEAMSPWNGTDTVYLHTRFALMDKDITGITAGFISLICNHLNYIHDNYEMLIADIENGTIDESVDICEADRKNLCKRILPMPERAAELREVFKNGADFPFIHSVWPKMQYYNCAGGDGFSVYDKRFEELYAGGALKRIYNGITASEGMWTAPVAANAPNSVLIPDSAVMEFLPVEAGDDFSQIKEIDELEIGKTYELVITNLCGFYRYRMSDAVRVVGKWHHTPMVEFMYRVNKTINLACEKTTEYALKIMAENTAKCLNFRLFDYEVYPDPTVFPPQYKVLIEVLEDIPHRVSKEELDRVVLDKLCKANEEFRDCYESKEILAPDCYFESPQTQLLYMDLMTARGENASQIKPVHIISTEVQKKFFMSMRILWE